MGILERLANDRRGAILLAQLWRSWGHASCTRGGEAVLSEFFSRLCELDESEITTDDHGCIDISATVMSPIVWKDIDSYRFQHCRKVNTELMIGSIMSVDGFSTLFPDSIGAPIRQNSENLHLVFNRLKVENLDPSKRVGYRPPSLDGTGYGQVDTVWVTDWSAIAEYGDRALAQGIGSQEDAAAIRNALGLSQFSSVGMVLLKFRAGTLREHAVGMRSGVTSERAAPPYFFDGAGHPRFFQFDTPNSDGWNNALNLSYLEDPSADIKGAPELIVTSIPASEISEFVAFLPPGNSPCLGKDKEVLTAMLGPISAEAMLRDLHGRHGARPSAQTTEADD